MFMGTVCRTLFWAVAAGAAVFLAGAILIVVFFQGQGSGDPATKMGAGLTQAFWLLTAIIVPLILGGIYGLKGEFPKRLSKKMARTFQGAIHGWKNDES